jgi:hypothetical protein
MQRSEIYKAPHGHETDVPRPGDLAEIRRGHCRANAEAGLLVQVMGAPHLCFAQCADCGSEILEYQVEVHSDDPHWQKTPGPWFYPIRWLRRLDPRDPVDYARVLKYRPLFATTEQLKVANP